MTPTEKALDMARRRPMPEEKMHEGLAKLRKNATGWLTFGKLVQVLDRLGWSVKSVLGWTPLHYTYQGHEELVFEGETRAEGFPTLHKLHGKMKAEETEPPAGEPESIGERVISDVSDVVSHQPGTAFFTRREWVGTEGVEITSPRGESVIFLPDHHDVRRRQLSIAESPRGVGHILRWLWESGFEDDVNAALATEQHVPAAERTRENTGTCGFCWKNVKLEAGRLVLHGYRRPGTGETIGRCPGTGHGPLETSIKTAELRMNAIVGTLDKTSEQLRHAKAGEVESIYHGRRGGLVVRKGEPTFEHHLANMIWHAEREIKALMSEQEFYEQILKAWKPRSLPREGERERGVKFFLAG